jgi:hypothetical protein
MAASQEQPNEAELWNPQTFFQKVLSREINDNFCVFYGLGYPNPKVPFIFQSLQGEQRKESGFFDMCILPTLQDCTPVRYY